MLATRFILAVAQARSVRYDKDANLAKAEDLMALAANRGAAAILFPEMFLTGYALKNRLAELAEPLHGPSLARLAELSRHFKLLTVCGFPEEREGSRPYNSACIISSDGSVLGSYRKAHLFGREPEFFSEGDGFPVFDTPLGRVGVAICFDIEFPETARLLTLRGARLILNPTANMDPYSQYQAVYLRARAMENGIYVAAANTVGEAGTLRYFGESAVVDPRGSVRCEAGSEEEMLFAELDLGEAPGDQELEYLARRRPELYGELAQNHPGTTTNAVFPRGSSPTATAPPSEPSAATAGSPEPRRLRS